MSTDAPHHGQAAAAGKPTTGRNTAETIAAPTEIKTVVASGSSPRLMVAFHPAWHAAANSTAAKTNGSIARIILGVCGRPSGDRHPRRRYRARSIAERRARPDLRRGALVLFGAGDLGAEDMGRAPAPMGVVEHGARERHHIGLALGDDRLGLQGVAISPTVRVAMPASRLTFSANCTFVLATKVGRVSALMPPEEMQTKSSPAAFNAVAKLAASSGVNPPSTQSLPVMRAPSGMPRGMPARTARAISSG